MPNVSYIHVIELMTCNVSIYLANATVTVYQINKVKEKSVKAEIPMCQFTNERLKKNIYSQQF